MIDRNLLVSIVMLNYNGSNYIEDCILSIKNQSYDNVETIVVDNASTDDSLRKVENVNYDIKIVKNRENFGSAKANNIGAKEANGKYLFFLNVDTRLEKDCIKNLVLKCEKEKKVDVCACQEVSYDNFYPFDCGIGLDIFGYGYPGKPGKIFYSPSSSLFIKKQIFDNIGGFDESYFMYKDDIDLCWRLHLQDYKIEQVPEAIVHHKGGGVSLAKNGTILNPRKIKNKRYIVNVKRRYLGERNTIYTLLKNYSLISLLIIIPIYLLINICEMLFFMFMMKPKIISDVYLKSYLYILKNMGKIIKKRQIVQRNRKVNDLKILKFMEKKIGKFSAFKAIGIPEIK